MSKELEEAIVLLNNLKNTTSTQEYVNNFNTYDNAIETVLQASEELQQKERSRIIGNIKEIKIEDLESILKPYYISKDKLKESIEKARIKMFSTRVMNEQEVYFLNKCVNVINDIQKELLEEK